MKIKRLFVRNIRSYEELAIEFSSGSTLLSGDIGVGKTSILLALQFALFGLQPGQKGASILRNGETEANVKVFFDVDGKEISIERALKKSKNGSISQEKNIIEIDGKTEELSTSEMKNRVISLLDYPKEFAKKSNLLYKFTVYTPQEEMKAIIQERPEIRLDTLRHVFGIDRYKRIKENAQIFLQKIKESVKVKEALIAELPALREKLQDQSEKKIQLARETNNLKVEFSQLNERKKEAQNNINEIQEKIDKKRALDAELSKNKFLLQGKKELITKLQKEIFEMQSQLKNKIEFSPEKLAHTTELLNQHNENLDKLNKQFIEVTSKISALESQKTRPTEMKEKISSLENCPTCFQRVSQEHKEKIAKKTQYELEDINRELDQKLIEKQQLIKNLESEKELIKKYQEDKSALQEEKFKFEQQKNIDTKLKSEAFVLERTQNESSQIEKRISELTNQIEAFSQIEEKFQELKTNFDKISEETRKKEITLAEKNKELEMVKTQLENLNSDILKKEKTKEQSNYLRELQDWLQEKFLTIITLTETNVLAKLRNEFSRIFSDWFSILIPEHLAVRLDEDFTPIITNRDYEIDYSFLSGGERTAVALAYRLALNQVLNSLLSKIKTKGLVILDEPTEGFASEQLEKIRDVFDQLESEQIILVSHEQKIEGFVDHVIKITKGENSSVEKENLKNPNSDI